MSTASLQDRADAQPDTRRMLADSVRDYLARGYGTATRLASVAHPHGYPPERWQAMAALGWTALPLAEDDGGLGGALADVCAVTEGLGRGLVQEPFIPCAVLGATLLADAVRDPALRQAWLPRLAAGEARVALAAGWSRLAGDNTEALAVTALRQGPGDDGFRLDGNLAQVLGGAGADAYLLVAQMDDGQQGLFLLPAATPGLGVRVQRWYDGQAVATLALSDVRLGAALCTGAPAAVDALLSRAVQRATLAHCAETVGAMQGAFDTTLDYLRTRRQFGRSIASNQVVQHRLVDLLVEIEEARALTRAAAEAFDVAQAVAGAPAADDGSGSGSGSGSGAGARADVEATATATRLGHAARACVALAARQIWEESVQLHGAIGMTQEGPVGDFVKRLATACTVYGSAVSRLERLAALALDAPAAAEAPAG